MLPFCLSSLSLFFFFLPTRETMKAKEARARREDQEMGQRASERASERTNERTSERSRLESERCSRTEDLEEHELSSLAGVCALAAVFFSRLTLSPPPQSFRFRRAPRGASSIDRCQSETLGSAELELRAGPLIRAMQWGGRSLRAALPTCEPCTRLVLKELESFAYEHESP